VGLCSSAARSAIQYGRLQDTLLPFHGVAGTVVASLAEAAPFCGAVSLRCVTHCYWTRLTHVCVGEIWCAHNIVYEDMDVAHGVMSSGSYWNFGVVCCPNLQVRSGDSRLLRNWVALGISTAVICPKNFISKIYVFLNLPVFRVLKETGGLIEYFEKKKSEIFW